MNQILTIAQKTGTWIWRQKEKMVLLLLVGFFGVRVFQVVYGPGIVLEDGPKPKPPAEAMGLPPSPQEKPRPPEFQSLVSRNPFSIYGLSAPDKSDRELQEQIDLILIRIVSWQGDSYRAEMQRATETRPKRYEEGEVFGDYQLLEINPEANTVTVYAREYDRNFTLEAQQGAP